ncbi:MAG: hypothetical protein O3A15_00085 [Proteobacteria bacterium]|jgi:hypothetical protein|nr:hypothetical protein [Pseudomonadota bacterium]
MNKSKVKEIKKIMNYEGHPQQKRLLRRFKKSYVRLSEAEKIEVIKDLKAAFEAKEEK